MTGEGKLTPSAPPGPSPISAVIIAGGKSTRLGQDKRRLRLWGQAGPTLLEHTVLLMARCCTDVVVVMNDPETWPSLPARIVSDVYPNMGALGGIYSGLQAAAQPYGFVVASDMPLLNPELIQWMIQQPRDYDALVPRFARERARNRLGVESLHAIYSRVCAEPIRRQLEQGNPQVIGFFREVRVRIIEHETLATFDPEGRSFRNINTPEELAEAHRLLDG